MTLERMFFVWALPFVVLSPWSGIRKYTAAALKVHILLCLSLLLVYVALRRTYGRNLEDLPKRIRSGGVSEFSANGCRMLLSEPAREEKRRILLFPGLGISVRRMLQEACMDGFVKDSRILCFQVRGLGESDWDVDISSKSMLEDSLHAARVFASMTDGSVRTLFVGYSLGCFVSMQLLSHLEATGVTCDNILLVNGMCSGERVVPHFRLFSSLLGVNVRPHLRRSDVPITALHAEDDQTVPIGEAAEMKAACDAIGRRCTVLRCGGSHSHYVVHPDTRTLLRRL